MKMNQLRTKIDEAKERLRRAEEAMAIGLQQLQPEVPGDKTMISKVLRQAFADVTAAKVELTDLEELLPRDDTP